jgi:peroxiredoxin
MRVRTVTILGAILAASACGVAPPASVADIQAAHDRSLVRDLTEYLRRKPQAEDLDQAYLTIFDKVIEHDWFGDYEQAAKGYLDAHPDGAVRSLAQIVATMARAQAGQFPQALALFKELVWGLGQADQEEFAANFADSLAGTATAAGEYGVARQVFEALLSRYGESPTVRQKVTAELARLDKVGQPAPTVAVTDVKGKAVRWEDLRGKYVLVDFWATWCAPCVAELPRVQAAFARYHDAGFEVVGVSLDETRAAVTDFAKARHLPWRQIHNASSGGDLVAAYGVDSIPATFLIDPRGVIARLDLRGPALDRALAQLLKPDRPAR